MHHARTWASPSLLSSAMCSPTALRIQALLDVALLSLTLPVSCCASSPAIPIAYTVVQCLMPHYLAHCSPPHVRARPSSGGAYQRTCSGCN